MSNASAYRPIDIKDFDDMEPDKMRQTRYDRYASGTDPKPGALIRHSSKTGHDYALVDDKYIPANDLAEVVVSARARSRDSDKTSHSVTVLKGSTPIVRHRDRAWYPGNFGIMIYGTETFSPEGFGTKANPNMKVEVFHFDDDMLTLLGALGKMGEAPSTRGPNMSEPNEVVDHALDMNDASGTERIDEEPKGSKVDSAPRPTIIILPSISGTDDDTTNLTYTPYGKKAIRYLQPYHKVKN